MTQQVPQSMIDLTTLAIAREGNRLINADMRIDQRNGGSSIAVTSASVFCVDRWRAGMNTVNGTGQRVACSLTSFPYMLQLTGAVGTTQAWIGQMIESLNTTSLVGQRVSISFYVASSVVANLTINLKAPIITDNFTSTTLVESQSVAITSTLTKYTLTFTNVMPAAVANGLYLEFVTTTSLGAGTFQMTGIQLEAGIQATPFEFRPMQQELAMCQRYYYKANGYPLGVTLNISDGYASLMRYPVQMRVNPTLDSGGSFTVGSGSAGTVQLSTTNGECGLMRNSANNWTPNITVSVTAGFSAEIS